MPAKKSWGDHGTIRRYRQGGCDDLRGGTPGHGQRCAECILAAKEFRAGERAGIVNPKHGNVLPLDKRRRGSKKGLSSVKTSQNSTETPPDTSSKPPKGMGDNESAVIEQLEQFREAQPVLVSMAVTCARILDDSDRVTLHTSTIRQLSDIVGKLTGGRKTKSKGRLASVQRMTARAR